jgi:hypothetical protein
MNNKTIGLAALGLLVACGLTLLGFQLARGLVAFKALERTVTVKGLAEREVEADIAIWPITFSEADNDLGALFATIERHNALIVAFLEGQGFAREDVSIASPTVVDRQAQGYNAGDRLPFRYAAQSTVTVYTRNVDQVRASMNQLVALGKQGIALGGAGYQAQTEFIFTRLNDIKPAMIEEATRNAREVAAKFAADSDSRLGKIKTALQGQFSITDRDRSTPYIKKVRVVSTVAYYLAD